MKELLFLTYYWPPSGKASIHFPLDLIRHLDRLGWKITVATVEEDTFTQKDFSLVDEIPPTVEVHKIKSFEPFNLYRKFTGKAEGEPLIASETISRENKSIAHKISIWLRMNLFVPDARVGWYPYAVSFLKKIMKHKTFDALLSMGPPHSTHLIGKRLSKKFNVPHIPILIDPWVDIVYYQDFKRNWLTLNIDKSLEKSVMSHARHVVFVTETTRSDFIVKHPSLKEKSTVLYWGYNEDAFAKQEKEKRDNSAIVITHAGNIFDYQNPIRLWEYLRNQIIEGKNYKIQFIGTVSPGIKESIKQNNLESVTEFLGFLPYNQVITKLCNSDVLLVCTTEKRHVPGKLFEYFRTQNPILCFGDENEEVKELLQNGRAGKFVHYTESGCELLENLSTYRCELSYAKKFDRKTSAEILARIVEHLKR